MKWVHGLGWVTEIQFSGLLLFVLHVRDRLNSTLPIPRIQYIQLHSFSSNRRRATLLLTLSSISIFVVAQPAPITLSNAPPSGFKQSQRAPSTKSVRKHLNRRTTTNSLAQRLLIEHYLAPQNALIAFHCGSLHCRTRSLLHLLAAITRHLSRPTLASLCRQLSPRRFATIETATTTSQTDCSCFRLVSHCASRYSMSSLSTLFDLRPHKLIEFVKTCGSKAFLHYI